MIALLLYGTFDAQKYRCQRHPVGKNAPPGFARLGVGAPWRGKNKDPQRASIAS